jgi:tetrapyrrole methylase family protein/MazG family protein
MEQIKKELVEKKSFDINDLVTIVKVLRSETGCPWDKVQTHESIKKDLLEETYEVMEAIDCKSPEMMQEELGDVLLQVVFHTVLESEQGHFELGDVTNDVCRKLIVRHPHVFGDVNVEGVDDVLRNWDSIKMDTKGQQTFTDTLKSVPKNFPALMRAQKVGQRAKRAGMDFRCAEDAVACIAAEKAELDAAIAANDQKNIQEELGDLLFSCVNASRHLGVDAEFALSMSTEKFIRRFAATEELVSAEGKDMKGMDIDQLDVYWDKAKNLTNSEEKKNDQD